MPQGADPALVEVVHAAISKKFEVVYAELPLAETKQETGDFLFRSMSYREFDAFSRTAQIGDITDLVVRELLIYPEVPWEENLIQKVDCGAFDEVALFLVAASGFDSKKGLYEGLSTGRGTASTPFSAAQMFIARAFPAVTPASVAEMGASEMFRHVAMAEHLLGQDGKPTRFPLREIMGDGAPRQQTSKVPWDKMHKMRVLTPEQVEQLKYGDRARYVVEKVREARALNADPEAKKTRAIAIRRERMDKIAAQRQADAEAAGRSESADLASEFGG